MAIPVSAKSGGNFTPHPEGQYVAVCCDVHDVGPKKQIWNGKEKIVHKVDLYFYCGEFKELDDGTQIPLLVRERFTASLSDKAKLLPFVEKLYGKLSADEKEWFDLETLIGRGCQIEVVHNETEQGTFANIDSIMRLPKGAEAPEIPASYVRAQDRPPRDSQQQNQQQQGRKSDPIAAMAQASRKDQRQPAAVSPFVDDDDDLPF